VIKRVGILGGAFDPPHLAHVALAQSAFNELELEVLHVVPTGQAWHKTRELTSVTDRMAMVRLAFTGHSQDGRSSDKICIDEREILRNAASYTIDTLEEIECLYPSAQLFLIMGQDQAESFTTWKAHERIVEKAQVVIASRRVGEFSKSTKWTNRTNRTNRTNSSTDPSLEQQAALRDAIYLNCPLMPISATEVRASIEQGLDVSQLVPELVLNYIQQQGLYSKFS